MSRPGDRYRCACVNPLLIAHISGRAAPVYAAFAGDPLSRIYCTRCRGRYIGPWQLAAQNGGRLPTQ